MKKPQVLNNHSINVKFGWIRFQNGDVLMVERVELYLRAGGGFQFLATGHSRKNPSITMHGLPLDSNDYLFCGIRVAQAVQELARRHRQDQENRAQAKILDQLLNAPGIAPAIVM